jgi:ABC-2 type transport system permease protein
VSFWRRIAIRTTAFLVKESVVALGQPRLLLSVVAGPFLLLLLFGLGFTGDRAPFRTVLVVPDRPGIPKTTEAYDNLFLWSLNLVDVSTSADSALARLRRRDVDAVVVAPPHPLDDLAQDRQAAFDVYYNHLDPLDRSRIGSVAFGHTRELNALLVAAMLDAVLEATGVRESDEPALQNIRARLLTGDSDGALAVIDRLLAAIVILRIAGETAFQTEEPEQPAAPTTPPLDRFEAGLRLLRAQVEPQPGITPEQEAQLTELEQTSLLLPGVINAAARISPSRLASPVTYRLSNLAPSEVTYLRFYAPVVIALLLQHVAVTLAALSVVRERTRGTVEVFAVAPVRLGEILIGKALSFGAIIVAVAAVLLVLVVFVLGVPMLGNVLLLGLIILLLVAASLAIGFTIANLATTETQAVQLAMLVLLFATFFGGLFIPLVSLGLPVRLVSYAIPVTHAGVALRAVMLRGDLVPADSLAALGLFIAILGPLAVLLMRRSFRMR